MKIYELAHLLNVTSYEITEILNRLGYSIPNYSVRDLTDEQISKIRAFYYLGNNKLPEEEKFRALEFLDFDYIKTYMEKYAVDVFRICSFSLTVGNNDPVFINLMSDFCNCSDDSTDQFSLLIGLNGIGKSSILRGLIDFFVDLEYYKENYGDIAKRYRRDGNRYVRVNSVFFVMDHVFYHVYRDQKQKVFWINGDTYVHDDFEVPHIVASCFGVFDKFPLQNTYSGIRRNRYDVDCYTYVGAKASGNMFSVSAIIFQLLNNLLSISGTSTFLKINDALSFIGYEGRISFSCKLLKTICLSYEDFARIIDNYLSDKNNNVRRKWYAQSFLRLGQSERFFLYQVLQNINKTTDSKDGRFVFDVDFVHGSVAMDKNILKAIYQLRQLGFITNVECNLFKAGNIVNCNAMSSGEFNMLCTIIGTLSASENGKTMVLIDEPEISQHPNWQMQIIDMLDKCLSDSKCHFIIATHSHFLVSDLPNYKSSVTYLYQEKGNVVAENIKEATYGWSAEEVLLKVFKVLTTRNIYLADMVGKMLDLIANNQIEYDKVEPKIRFLESVVKNMQDVDPMKKVLYTIIDTFRNEK